MESPARQHTYGTRQKRRGRRRKTIEEKAQQDRNLREMYKARRTDEDRARIGELAEAIIELAVSMGKSPGGYFRYHTATNKWRLRVGTVIARRDPIKSLETHLAILRRIQCKQLDESQLESVSVSAPTSVLEMAQMQSIFPVSDISPAIEVSSGESLISVEDILGTSADEWITEMIGGSEYV
jgi:hypothetical protein